jgi:hypothetical protein
VSFPKYLILQLGRFAFLDGKLKKIGTTSGCIIMLTLQMRL